MTQTDILEELKRIPTRERIVLIEEALHSISDELQPAEVFTSSEERDIQLQRAAELMRDEYLTDKELTAFTALDGEDFYDYEKK
jgi:hypothetical protein